MKLKAKLLRRVRKKIMITCSDGVTHLVAPYILKFSAPLRVLVHKMRHEKREMDSIPLLEVSSPILLKLIAWARYHKDEPIQYFEYVHDPMGNNYITRWDYEFFKLYPATLAELMKAAEILSMTRVQFLIKRLTDAPPAKRKKTENESKSHSTRRLAT